MRRDGRCIRDFSILLTGKANNVNSQKSRYTIWACRWNIIRKYNRREKLLLPLPVYVYRRTIPKSDARKTTRPFAAVSEAALALVLAAGAEVEEVAAFVLDALDGADVEDPEEDPGAGAEPAEGTLKPLTPLAVRGPGAALALAPTPTRLGEGFPESVGKVALAAAWKASKPPGGALMVLLESA